MERHWEATRVYLLVLISDLAGVCRLTWARECVCMHRVVAHSSSPVIYDGAAL